jgi:hypothetical protein
VRRYTTPVKSRKKAAKKIVAIDRGKVTVYRRIKKIKNKKAAIRFASSHNKVFHPGLLLPSVANKQV